MIRNTLMIAALFLMVSCASKLAPDASWGGRNWVVYELQGVPVQLSGNADKDAHIVFIPSNRQFSGTGGCNRINGAYTLGKKKSINFGNAASTMMACPDMAFEDRFMEALKSVDGYDFDGNSLLLRKGREVVMRLR